MWILSVHIRLGSSASHRFGHCLRSFDGSNWLASLRIPEGRWLPEPFPPETTGAFQDGGQTATGRRFHPVIWQPEQMFSWRDALMNVQPDTLLRWHRKGFRLFWRWKSKPTGRPRLPRDLRDLIGKLAAENPIWGEERIANELKLKLGIRVSPRTVRKYLNSGGPRREPDPKQRWLTFVRNHAKWIVASDFFVVVTVSFRTLYVFLIMELGTRRILHHTVTAHPTAEWTLQQFREALPGDHPYRFLIHDRDSIFSKDLDQAVVAMGVGVLRTPVRAPKANSVCERLGGTLRRECLDYLIPDQRTASEDDYQRVGNPLQPRQAALLTRPWITGTHPGERSGERPQTPAARRLPCCEGFCARRVTSRISPGERGRLTTSFVFADDSRLTHAGNSQHCLRHGIR
jgi:hypothetical protein